MITKEMFKEYFDALQKRVHEAIDAGKDVQLGMEIGHYVSNRKDPTAEWEEQSPDGSFLFEVTIPPDKDER